MTNQQQIMIDELKKALEALEAEDVRTDCLEKLTNLETCLKQD